MNSKIISIFLSVLTTLGLSACSIEAQISAMESIIPSPITPEIPEAPVPTPVPAAGQVPFESTFLTSLAHEQIILPLRHDNGFTYDIVVDWGDGTFDTFTSSNPIPVQHSYSTAGSYTIKFWGQAEAFSFASIPHSRNKLTGVANMGNLGWKSLDGAFEATTALTNFAIGAGGETTQVTSFRNLFKDSLVNSVDLNSLDTASATDLSGMFEGVLLTSLDLSALVTSSVQDMSGMFKNAAQLNPSVASFSFASVTNAQGMFEGSGLQTNQYDVFLQRASSTSVTNKNVVVGNVPASHTYNTTLLNYKNELTNSNLQNWTINDITSINNKIVFVFNLSAGTHTVPLPVKSDATDWAHEDGTANGTTFQNEFIVSVNGTPYDSFTNQRRKDDHSTWRNNEFFQFTPGDSPLVDRPSVGPTVSVSITAPTAGEYIVELDGLVEKLAYVGSCPNTLVRVESLGNTGLRSLAGAFQGCSQLTWVGHGNLEHVTVLSGFVQNTHSLAWVDTGHYDVRNVRSFAEAFRQAPNLEHLNFTRWETSSALTFRAMFDQSHKLDPDLSSFDFSKVLNDHHDGWQEQRHLERIFSATSISATNYTKLLIRLADDTYGLKHNLTPANFSGPNSPRYLKTNLHDVSKYNHPLPKIDIPYSVEACPAMNKLNMLLNDIPQAVTDGAVGLNIIDDAGLEGGGVCPP